MVYVSLFLASLLVWAGSALQRLPDNIAPERYKLQILTDLDELKYYGEVTIVVNCKFSTDVIKLHVSQRNNNLNVGDATVTFGKPTDEDLVKTVDFDSKNDFMVIYLKQYLSIGQKYVLHIPFKGSMTFEPEGYYVVGYEDNNQLQLLSITNFKYINARSVFPCFDEPGLKAVFSIKLGHRKKFTSVSNMPIKRTVLFRSDDNGWIWDEFDDTPLMPTYQLVFSVLEERLKQSSSGSEMGLYAVPGHTQQLTFAIDVAPSSIKCLDMYLGIPYPLPKLDFIIVPFGTLVQEYWGVLPTMDGYFDEDVSNNGVFKDISHEKITKNLLKAAASQWLGNLVSIKWWDNSWFFPTLSSYFAEIISQEVHSNLETKMIELWDSWSIWDSYPYSFDTLYKPNYIINYSSNMSPSPQMLDKGILILRMLHLTFGNIIFTKSLQELIKKYSYKTAGPDEFWDIVTKENDFGKGSSRDLLKVSSILKSPLLKYKYWGDLTLARMGYNVDGVPQSDEPPITHAKLPQGITVKHLMDNWIKRPGYPIIYVTRLKNGIVKVNQKRFLSENIRPSKPKDCWWIPITYSSTKKLQFDNTFPTEWLGCKHYKTGLIFDTGARPNDWIILNNKCSGLYRVQYDDHGWNLIIKALNSPHYWKIHEFNRGQLVNDALSLASSGELSYKVAFNLLSYLRQEESLLLWRMVLNGLDNITTALYYTRKYRQFQEIMKPILTPIFKSIFQNIPIYTLFSEAETLKIEMDIFSFSCKMGVERCIEQLPDEHERWKDSKKDPEVIFPYPVQMGSNILCYNIKYENKDEDFEYVKDMLRKASQIDDKSYYFDILRCTNNELHIKELLEWTIDGSEDAMLSGDLKIYAFKQLVHSRVAAPLLLKFFYNRFTDINRVLGSLGQPEFIIHYVKEIVSTQYSLKRIRQMRTFLLSLIGFQYTTRCLTAVYEGTSLAMPNINWVNRHYNTFDEILKESTSDSNSPAQPQGTTTPQADSKNILETDTKDIQ